MVVIPNKDILSKVVTPNKDILLNKAVILPNKVDILLNKEVINIHQLSNSSTLLNKVATNILLCNTVVLIINQDEK